MSACATTRACCPNSDYIFALQNTIQFTLWSLGIKFVTGMTIALILNSRIPARSLISGIMLLPWIVPEIVTALAWRSIYDPLFGGLNPILQGLGLIDQPVGWLSDPHLAMSSIITVNIWKGIPFYTLLLLAGLKAIDRELLEAAEVDGANVVQRFRHVTLPGLRYVIVVVLLLSFISTFNQFGLPFLMTGGGPSGATRLYSILAYEKAIGSLQYGPGSAIAHQRRAAHGGDHLAARQVHAARRGQVAGARASPISAIAFCSCAVGLFDRLLDLRLPSLRAGDYRASRGSAMPSVSACVVRRMAPLLQPRPAAAAGHARDGCSCCSRSWCSCCFPFFWVVITSFKTTQQISARTVNLLANAVHARPVLAAPFRNAVS